MSLEYVSTAWCCVDCLFSLVNGETADDETHETRLEHGLGDLVAFPGLRADEHATDCPVFPYDEETDERGDYDGSEECGCETDTFSWRACHLCRSPLGGSRHAFTLFRETDTRDEHEDEETTR